VVSGVEETSTGFHVLEIHAPTVGLGLGSIALLVVLTVLMITCWRKLRKRWTGGRRGAERRGMHHMQQPQPYAQQWMPPNSPFAPWGPTPAQMQQMQQLMMQLQPMPTRHESGAFESGRFRDLGSVRDVGPVDEIGVQPERRQDVEEARCNQAVDRALGRG
jgi:hypothetical protein